MKLGNITNIFNFMILWLLIQFIYNIYFVFILFFILTFQPWYDLIVRNMLLCSITLYDFAKEIISY